jgi:hypothetical protein
MSLVIKVVDSKDQNKVIMTYIEPISSDMTVADFKSKLCKDSDFLSKHVSVDL